MKRFFSIILILISFTADASTNKVTYRLSGGRFGDNLLAYMHAKWVSYLYGMPLVYHDFPYANDLILDEYEEKMEPYDLRQKIFQQRGDLDAFIDPFDSQTLYVIPYFPESAYELSMESYFSYFQVDWENTEFKAVLNKMIAPKKELKKLVFPPGRISVALHIRRGPGFDGGFDSIVTTKPSVPLKFPSQQFYIDAIKRLYVVFKKAPMYVYIFTDDIDPLSLLNCYEMEFKNDDIVWGCRQTDNHWNANVLEDFFALIEFDCAVHGESNLAMCAGKMANYQIEIMPETFHLEEREPLIDSVVVVGKNSEIVYAYKEAL